MDVLIIASTKDEYQACLETYSREHQIRNKFHHITKREQMFGYEMPVQIRFYGNWYELPEARDIEWTASIITRQPRTEASVRV